VRLVAYKAPTPEKNKHEMDEVRPWINRHGQSELERIESLILYKKQLLEGVSEALRLEKAKCMTDACKDAIVDLDSEIEIFESQARVLRSVGQEDASFLPEKD
jgi:hypothetical protein